MADLVPQVHYRFDMYLGAQSWFRKMIECQIIKSTLFLCLLHAYDLLLADLNSVPRCAFVRVTDLTMSSEMVTPSRVKTPGSGFVGA